MEQGTNKVKKSRKVRYNVPTRVIILMVVVIIAAFALVGNILKDKALINGNKSVSVESNTSYKNNGNNKKSLNIDSRLVQILYSRVYDDRYGQLNSWIYPDLDSILISDMDEVSKMKLVFSGIQSSAFSNSDCNVATSTVINYNNKNYTCAVGLNKYIKADRVINKYKELFGSTTGFDNSTLVMADGGGNYLYVYGIDKDTNEEGYYMYGTTGDNIGSYLYTRNLTKAVQSCDTISLTENIVASASNGAINEENIIYTFKLGDDGLYSYYSRVKQK